MDEEGEGPLECGIIRYKQKDYHGAIEEFSDAVDTSSGHLQHAALDYRAATYEKLGKLYSALKDSKQMLDIKPELAKGYLRCGKILQMKGEHKLALQIYERGLQKIRVGTDPNRSTIQALYNKLKQANDPKSLDPLSFLPIEIIDIIVQNLSLQDRVTCLSVSVSWKRILLGQGKLWTTFDTRFARKPINQQALRAFLKRSRHGVEVAMIAPKSCMDSSKMEYMLETCKSLKQLEFHGHYSLGASLRSLSFAKSLRILYVGANIGVQLNIVSQVLQYVRHTITEATFLKVNSGFGLSLPWPQLHYLEVLTIHMNVGGEVINVPALCGAVPNIVALSLDLLSVGLSNSNIDLRTTKKLTRLELRRADLSSFPYLTSNVTHINYDGNLTLGVKKLGMIHLVELSNLQHFSCELTACSSTTISEIISPSIRNGSLQTLHIGRRLPIGPSSSEKYPSSSSVINLSLTELHWREERFISVVNQYPSLHTLNVSGTRVTGVAIKCFVKHGIKVLKVNECSDLGSDAVDYARSKGVEVEYTFPSRRGNSTYRGAFGPVY